MHVLSSMLQTTTPALKGKSEELRFSVLSRGGLPDRMMGHSSVVEHYQLSAMVDGIIHWEEKKLKREA